MTPIYGTVFPCVAISETVPVALNITGAVPMGVAQHRTYLKKSQHSAVFLGWNSVAELPASNVTGSNRLFVLSNFNTHLT